jgi:hypothetical protein
MSEAKTYNKWVKPTDKDLELEYKIEYDIKPLKGLTNNAFPTVDDFKKAAKAGRVMEVTPQIDRKIAYRSRTGSRNEIISLIKGYASYPEFRNEKTIDNIYKAFENNTPMTMPIVLEMPDGSMRVMGGNTRMDIAQHSGINPKVLLIKVPKK